MVKYGKNFPDGWTDAMVELWCYANKHSSSGGLGEQAHLKNAMLCLWPHLYAGEVEPGVPRWREELELLTWAWTRYRIVTVLGHASAAKTHTFGHIAAASYLASPTDSIITLTSTHLGGLRKRLWSDTTSAVKSAELIPGAVYGGDQYDVRAHDMTIRPRGTQEDKYLIEGIATDRGQDAVEKIQGNHSKNRRYVVIDEAQGTPKAIFDAAANLMSDADFRIVMLANPTKRYSEFGTWCEPLKGWASTDPEIDIYWETKRGGICIRLDGLRSANIRLGHTVFPFLIRQDYIDSVRQSYGEGSPRWWTFVRGWFAPEGLFGVVFPSNVLSRAERIIDYQVPPTPIAALDPAFEGGDQCALAFGEYGYANDNPHALNFDEVVTVKVAVSENSDPLDYLIAREVMRQCKARGITPDNFIMDVTGAGRGVAAILAREWGTQIHRCNFGGACTDRRLKKSEQETAIELFDRFVSELWWSGRAWMEEGLVGGLTEASNTLREQLSARQYETVKDKKISIEPKTEMKSRLGYSPDEADAFVLLIELLRRKGAIAGKDPAKGGQEENPMNKLAKKYSKAVDADKEFNHGDA